MSGIAEKVCIPIVHSHPPTTAARGGGDPAIAA